MDFLILALATWRMASLAANEDGPYAFFERARRRLGVRYAEDGVTRYGTNELARMVICVWCNSVWIGGLLTLAYWQFRPAVFWLALPFALSAGAVLVERLVNGE